MTTEKITWEQRIRIQLEKERRIATLGEDEQTALKKAVEAILKNSKK